MQEVISVNCALWPHLGLVPECNTLFCTCINWPPAHILSGSHSRDWRYHKEEKIWITRAPGEWLPGVTNTALFPPSLPPSLPSSPYMCLPSSLPPSFLPNRYETGQTGADIWRGDLLLLRRQSMEKVHQRISCGVRQTWGSSSDPIQLTCTDWQWTYCFVTRQSSFCVWIRNCMTSSWHHFPNIARHHDDITSKLPVAKPMANHVAFYKAYCTYIRGIYLHEWSHDYHVLSP